MAGDPWENFIHGKLSKVSIQAASQFYTLGEEIAHSVSHGFGAALSIAGLTLLVVLAVQNGSPLQVISFSVYGGTLVIQYLASTLYHSFQHPPLKRIFQVIDHASIYLLIAGTYTPFLLVGVQGKLAWTFLALIWGIAILGISFKALFFDRFQRLSVLAYILMGWLGIVLIQELLVTIPIGGLIWMAVGGVIYTIGVIFYALNKIRYMHAVWHFFVLAGALCHWLFIYLDVVPG